MEEINQVRRTGLFLIGGIILSVLLLPGCAGADSGAAEQAALPESTAAVPTAAVATAVPPTPFPDNVLRMEPEIIRVEYFPPFTLGVDLVSNCRDVFDYELSEPVVSDDRVILEATVVVGDPCDPSDTGYVVRQRVFFDPLQLAPEATAFRVVINGRLMPEIPLVVQTPVPAENVNGTWAECPLDLAQRSGQLAMFGRFCMLLPAASYTNFYADYQRLRTDIGDADGAQLRLIVDSTQFLDNGDVQTILPELLGESGVIEAQLEIDGQPAWQLLDGGALDEPGAIRYLVTSYRGTLIWFSLETLAAGQEQVFNDTWAALLADFGFNLPVED